MPNVEFSHVIQRLLRQDSAEEVGLSTLKEAFTALDKGDTEEAKRLVEYARLEWQVVHDMYVNWSWAFFTFVAQEMGEDAVERAMRFVMASYFTERYDKIMAASVETQLQVTIEGMRGHLFGTDRSGEMQVIDEGVRYKLVYALCGTGGVVRKRLNEGKEPHPELFGFSQSAHSWTWGKRGVCYYCGHCAMVNEILPIEHYGHPMRVTDFNNDPNGGCVWYIYKDPKDIPAEYYERVGKQAPADAPRLGVELVEGRSPESMP